MVDPLPALGAILLWVGLVVVVAYWRRTVIRRSQLEKAKQLEAARQLEVAKQLEMAKMRRRLVELKEQILQAGKEFEVLSDETRYLSRREFHSWKGKWSGLASQIEECMRAGRPADVDFAGTIDRVVGAYHTTEESIRARNRDFVEREILAFRGFFDSVESKPLNYEQRRAIVVDEGSNRVIAGAGTGKTATIVGKAGYIIKKGLASPDEILLIAFNNDVVEEMDRRIRSRLGESLCVKTFHKLGLDIISEATRTKPSVSPLAEDKGGLLQAKMKEFVERNMRDTSFAEMIRRYFLYYSVPDKSQFDFKSQAEYEEYLRRFEIRSLKGDLVKSLEECQIANFLYANGIEYEYEKPYPVKTADVAHRQYKPDFFLPEKGTEKGIYIEHFGVDRQGRTAPYIPHEKYAQEMEWKRKTHYVNGTALVQTYSFMQQEGTLLTSLEAMLREKGVVFTPIPNEEIFAKLTELGRTAPFHMLLANFLNLYKSSGKSLEEIRRTVPRKQERIGAFLDIFSKVYSDYDAYLKERAEIDFNDMINEATKYVHQGRYARRFKYVLVDEFQDISLSRYRLLKSILDLNDARLYAVGDDWQSIYRFTGSDLSVMRDFERNFGFSETTYLQETFRFTDRLCAFSTKFITKNPTQIPKQIVSRSKAYAPAETIANGRTEVVLQDIVRSIAQESQERKSVFIIGRYNYLNPLSIKALIDKYPSLSISFTTAHRAKGLEADYVIVVGLRSGKSGFPCEIVDDPMLSLVLAEQDSFRNAEERRLFYVSITRARRHVFLLVEDRRDISPFVSEIQQEGYEVETLGQPRVARAPLPPPNKGMPERSYVVDSRRGHPKTYEKWSADEDRRLTADYAAGISVPQLAERLQRREGDVLSRLRNLGLIKRKD